MKYLFILLILAVTGYIAYTPVVEYQNIDWLKKSVTYRISILFVTISGIKYLQDKTTTTKTVANYSLNASSEGNKIILAVIGSKGIVKGLRIDFNNQTVTPLITGFSGS